MRPQWLNNYERFEFSLKKIEYNFNIAQIVCGTKLVCCPFNLMADIAIKV